MKRRESGNRRRDGHRAFHATRPTSWSSSSRPANFNENIIQSLINLRIMEPEASHLR